MARKNLTIADDLKKRMDKVKEPVDWSAVAAAAFEQKLGEFALQKKEKKVEDVIQRLRAAAVEEASDTEREGHRDGYEFARQCATPSELERLSQMARDDNLFQGDQLCCTWAELVVQKARGLSVDEMREESLDVIGSKWFPDKTARIAMDPVYLRAFIQGAARLWDEVRDKVRRPEYSHTLSAARQSLAMQGFLSPERDTRRVAESTSRR